VNVVHGQAPATVRAPAFPDDLVADLAASLAAAADPRLPPEAWATSRIRLSATFAQTAWRVRDIP
jgi:hypothetical protein